MTGSGSITVEIIVRGSQLLVAHGSDWGVSASDPAEWLIAYDDPEMEAVYGEPPAVGRVTLNEALDRAVLVTDAPFMPAVAYVLTPPPFYASAADPATFLGPRHAGPVDGGGSDRLVDVAAPVIRDGAMGGDYRLGADGDRELAGGLATITKALWHVLLRDASALRWKGLAPVRVMAEERRLSLAAATVINVRSAEVFLRQDGDHTRVTLRAETDLGPIADERRTG